LEIIAYMSNTNLEERISRLEMELAELKASERARI
jgi:uncharacterized small protein (DUF1192 family)